MLSQSPGRKKKSTGAVEGLLGCARALSMVHLCQRHVRLTTLNLQVNLVYEHSPETQLVRKLRTPAKKSFLSLTVMADGLCQFEKFRSLAKLAQQSYTAGCREPTLE